MKIDDQSQDRKNKEEETKKKGKAVQKAVIICKVQSSLLTLYSRLE